MFVPAAGTVPPQLPLVLVAIADGGALVDARDRTPSRSSTTGAGPGAWRWPSAFGVALALIVGNRPSPFLYFQF